MMGSNALPPAPSSPLGAVTCRMMPGQVDVYAPANSPYSTQNAYSAASPRPSPQSKKTAAAVPPVDTRMHVVTGRRSVSQPMATQPTTAAPLTTSSVSADSSPLAPSTRLDNIGRLVQQKRALKDEAEIDAAAPRGGQPRLHKVHEREGAGKQRGGPDAQRDAEPVAAEQELEQQRRGDAAEARPGPHDAVGQALASHEPLVHVEDARAVGDGPAERVQHALRRHQLRRRLRERAETQRRAHDHDAARGRVPRLLGIQPEQRHHERDVQVHDALRARAQVPMTAIWDEPAKGSCVE
ncbi:hypothetical protein BBAD15_g7302 [Beauveria bassiana D1-5]|uniref:Uncharacterized protein n=1 Tax=Beauveria bassiana D1-5 TaxID=1245745 RepID=A0A0A2VIE1_BEABA|nr:hypothetical protein BBAD15_g7302 [Beauveria bassiana D1-5]